MDNITTTTAIPPTSSTDKPLYLYPIPIVIDSFDLLMCLLCVIFNSSVILVTAMTKKIRKHRCCILLAVLSAAHVGAKVGTVVPKVIAWTVVTVRLFPNCILFVTTGIISGTTATFMTLMVALDRLIGAAFPVWYQNRGTSTYLLLIALIISVPCTYKLSWTYAMAVQPANAQKLVVCIGSDAQTPESATFNYFYGITATGSSVIAYLLVAVSLKWNIKRKPNSPFVKSTKKIFRSLMTIMCLNTFGWTFGFSFITVTYFLFPNLPPMTKIIIERLQALLMDTNSSIDAFILYFTSSLYRDAYNNLFSNVKQIFAHGQSSVSIVRIIPSSNQTANTLNNNNYQSSSTYSRH